MEFPDTYDNANLSTVVPYLLPFPVLDKKTWATSNSSLEVATSSMQGWRMSMEDVSVILLNMPRDRTNTMYFAVFDGHGGSGAAKYAGTNLHKIVTGHQSWEMNLPDAVYHGHIICDEMMRRDKNFYGDVSGATAVSVFIRGNTLCCSNLGDSRAIGVERGKVVPLSFDHKPNVPSEKRRILAAGGFVDQNRVNGNLALSRALGDFQYKLALLPPTQQIVSCAPDIITKKLDRKWEFVVLACDGIWDVMSNELVADFVRTRLGRMPLGLICEDLITKCLSPNCKGIPTGCDNMSVIIIRFKWSRLTRGRAINKKHLK